MHTLVPAFDRFADTNLRDKGSTPVPERELPARPSGVKREGPSEDSPNQARAECGTVADDGPHIMGPDRVYDNAYACQARGIEEKQMCAIHTTDSRTLSVTGLEYYNLDALGRKEGDKVRNAASEPV